MRGYLTQRSKGSWRLVVDAGTDPETGKRRQVTKTVRMTKRQAEDELAQFITEVAGGRHAAGDMTFRTLVTRWLANVETDLSESTVEKYESVLRLYILPVLGDRLVRKLRAGDLDEVYAAMKKKGKSPAYVRKAHTICSGALAQAVRWELIAANPAANARPGKLPRAKNRAPKTDVVQRLLEAVQKCDPEFYAYVQLDVLTGGRRGEVCALRWCDLDLEARTITFRAGVVATKGKLILKGTKTDDDRTITIPRTTVKVLKAHRRLLRERLLACGIPLADDSFVFPATIDASRPVRPDVISHRWLRIRRTVPGGEPVRLHDLRHHAATQLIAEGTNPRTVMARMGWTSSRTLDRYTASVDEKDVEAADRLEARLKRKPG